METRFRDTGQSIYIFIDEVLVECPRCSKCAHILAQSKPGRFIPNSARLVCRACGFTKDDDARSVQVGTNIDPYFKLPLWLQTPCCGETLWAYNYRHLNFLEVLVGARLRESRTNLGQTMAAKLPAWIKTAKNRDEVLKCIARLKDKEN